METFSFFIGIDISKATLDWAVIVSNKLLFHHQSTNDKAGIEGFIKQLKVYCPNADYTNSLYCMEHTGIYNNHLELVGEFKILRIVSIFVATKRQEYDCTI